MEGQVLTEMPNSKDPATAVLATTTAIEEEAALSSSP
jgi:hypothetical protein